MYTSDKEHNFLVPFTNVPKGLLSTRHIIIKKYQFWIFHLFVSGQEESYCDENIFALAQGLAICLNKTRKQIKILLKPYIWALNKQHQKSPNWLMWWIKQTTKTDIQLLCVTNGNVKLSLDFCVFCDVLQSQENKIQSTLSFSCYKLSRTPKSNVYGKRNALGKNRHFQLWEYSTTCYSRLGN